MKRLVLIIITLLIILQFIRGCKDPCKYASPAPPHLIGCDPSNCSTIYGLCIYKNGKNLLDSGIIDTSKIFIYPLDISFTYHGDISFKIVDTDSGKAISITNYCVAEKICPEHPLECYRDIIIYYRDSSFVSDTIRIENRLLKTETRYSPGKCFNYITVFYYNCFLYKLQNDSLVLLADSSMFYEPVIMEK